MGLSGPVAPVWTLVGICGPDQPVRKATIAGAQVMVGRLDDVDLRLEFRGVSKHHATLRTVDGVLWVRDHASTNGTFVNGKRIAAETALAAGDIVQFANAPFQVGCERVGNLECTQSEVIIDQALALLQFDRLMTERAVTPHFQPIVTLATGQIVAFEILARSRVAGLETAKELFVAASLVQQEIELSLLFREIGVRVGEGLAATAPLFLNTHPAELGDERLIRSLQNLRKVYPTTPLTLEIHESAVTDPGQIRELRAAFREIDVKIAYDDFGAGQARLLELAEAPPDYLKFDRRLIAAIHTAPSHRRQLLASLVRMVGEIGVVSLAEGVECREEGEVCRELGFELAQGYFYGRPDSPSRWFRRTDGDSLQNDSARNHSPGDDSASIDPAEINSAKSFFGSPPAADLPRD